MCNIFAATYKLKMGIHVENDGPILHAHDLPLELELHVALREICYLGYKIRRKEKRHTHPE